MKRTTALVLLLSLLLPALIACSGDSDIKSDDDITTDVVIDTTEDKIQNSDFPDALKELDYGGKTVNILTQNRNKFEHRWIVDEICVEEITGDPVNTAIYNRNAEVEKLLGVKIKQTVKNDDNKLKEAVNSGDAEFDIVAVPSDVGVGYIQSGDMYDLYSNGIEKYLNTESPWWTQYWIDEAEINGHLYAITGAPALSLSRFAMVMFYNKTMGNSFKYEDPYEVVNSGRWTIDYCNEIISGVYVDIDLDGDKNGLDRYGIAINADDNCDAFWSSFDMSLVTKGEDGWYELDASGKDRIVGAFEKIYTLVNENPDSFYTIDRVGLDDTRDMFSYGQLLLAPLHLKYAETQYFRYMNNDYTVLPMPKYDEAQSEYYTFVQKYYSIFMVPTTAPDPEMSGAVLEAMACESYKSLKPVYYDSVLKGRYTRDAETKQIVDMIMTNIKLDAALIYTELWSQPTDLVFNDLIDDGNKNFEKAYNNQQRIMKIILKDFNNNLESVMSE